MFVCPHKVKRGEMKKCTLKTSENRQDSHLNLHHILTHGPGERARLYCKRIETVLAPVVSFTGGEHRVGWAIRRRHMFLSQPPRLPDWRTSNGQTLTCLIETDEHTDAFFMKLVLGSYRTCLSVPVRPTQILCASPVGSRDHTDFYFVGVFLHSVLFFYERVFFHTWKLGLSLQLCSFVRWIFSPILPFVLLNDKLSKYVQGLNSSVRILERCLLQMLLIK